MFLTVLVLAGISLLCLLYLSKNQVKNVLARLFEEYYRVKNGPSPFKDECIPPLSGKVATAEEKSAVIKQAFSPDKVPNDLDAIIVGAGIGGLSTGVLLSKAGWKVLVLEKHDIAGGGSHTFMEHGYEFDIGVHVVGGMPRGSFLRSLSNWISNGQLDWAKLDDDFDEVIFYDKKFLVREGGPHVFCEQLKKWFPEEALALDHYFEEQQATRLYWRWLYISKRMNQYLCKFLVVTGLVHLLTTAFLPRAKKPAEQVIREQFSDPALRALLGYSCVNHGQALSDIAWWTHVEFSLPGGHFPVGGASQIPYTLIPNIERAGGKVLVKAPVKEILFNSDGRAYGVVVTKGSKEYTYCAKTIISNAGAPVTFKTLIPRQIAEKSAIWPVIPKCTVNPRAGVQVFIGLKGSNEELGLIARNYYFVKDMQNSMQEYITLTADQALDTVAPEFIVSFPSAKDPSWHKKYPDRATMLIITYANPSWTEKWQNERVKKRGDEYEAFKKTLGTALMEHVFDNHFPHLRDKVVYHNIATPLTHKYYLNNDHGEYFSMDHSITRFEPQNWAALRAKTDIPGLYLTGQDILYASVGGAMMSGLACAGAILNRDIWLDVVKVVPEGEKDMNFMGEIFNQM